MINYAIWKFVDATLNLLPESKFADIIQDFNFVSYYIYIVCDMYNVIYEFIK